MSAPAVRRVALVTGAARGIGAATTARLVEQGYHVVAFDWCVADGEPRLPYAQATQADLEQVARGANDRVVAVVGDVRDRAALQQAVEVAGRRWGRLDVAVAAAAVILGGQAAWETDPAAVELLWQIDVDGVWNTAASAVPAMLAGPDPSGCRFVAVASAAATHGLFHLAAYNAAKHAVVGIVKGLSADLVGTGTTAAAVSPGSTRTDMLTATAALYGQADVEDFGRSQRIHRLIEPDEIAATIAFCCSLEGGVVNGSLVQADGGFGA
ncbi:mycofactocin-coupled SDR family oxidoreductase [Leekyejoonella antrihumi]|uniref:SDR family oxidoreductase n=1 Tax=Leekyejoonella antrihumi TaxID=1660198 RepID=A0A563DVR7_9MICO|nr:mycofactocin-coupled SDR family oxidoreductase [Leekyejoonella antrihumi]TWP34219.1 SDR family oxidoreductase [Leekyejoonella antrihumi]